MITASMFRIWYRNDGAEHSISCLYKKGEVNSVEELESIAMRWVDKIAKEYRPVGEMTRRDDPCAFRHYTIAFENAYLFIYYETSKEVEK